MSGRADDRSADGDAIATNWENDRMREKVSDNYTELKTELERTRAFCATNCISSV